MARHTVVQILDDLDGSANATEVAFSFDGTDYTIDLSRKNRAAFEKALKPFVDSATKVPRRAGRRSKGAKTNLAAVRLWARENGIEVADRGRVPQSIIDRFEAGK